MRIVQYVSITDLLLGLLFVAIVATGVAISYSKHLSRKYFAELQFEQQTRDELQVEWSQLLLEQGAWGSNARVERIAREELHMEIPGTDNIEVLGHERQ